MHVLESHAAAQVREFGALAAWSGQGFEASNGRFKHHYYNHTARGGSRGGSTAKRLQQALLWNLSQMLHQERLPEGERAVRVGSKRKRGARAPRLRLLPTRTARSPSGSRSWCSIWLRFHRSACCSRLAVEPPRLPPRAVWL